MRWITAIGGAVVMVLLLGAGAALTIQAPEERAVRWLIASAAKTAPSTADAAESSDTPSIGSIDELPSTGLSTASSSTAISTTTISTTTSAEPVDAPARLGDSAGLPAIDRQPAPVGITIGSLSVTDAVVRSAGVLANGEMEVPAPTEVGWYRYGPTPGADGSAVLAAHIAASGVDGVFRHLDLLEPGAEITVAFDDGTTSTWSVIERKQYDKDSLPVDDLFTRSGPPRLTLITCGGAFNPSVRSYEDNVIVVAVPA